MARSQVTAFVAGFLGRYDVELISDTQAEGGKGSKPIFPRMDEGKPCSGVIGPVVRDDLIVCVTVRR